MNKSFITLLINLFLIMAATVSAQEKKAYTLEDVIPGGTEYYNWVPKNMSGLKWWGDVCVQTNSTEINTINLKNGKKKVLVTLDEINQAIAKANVACGALKSISGASFPWADRKEMTVMGNGYFVNYDFDKKEVTSSFALAQGATNFDFCKENGHMAYTVGDNLFIASATQESRPVHAVRAICPSPKGIAPFHDIVYGQSVHRQEFGIYKGTFWGPKGENLAFYRMDQSMVTDYPQVNTTKRIAQMEPDKYPMAGMTSHKVTVGIYNLASQKTIYLKAGDPTDRYFTNISWSPDEKQIYVIEVNRDQNHAQLVRYNAVTGDKEDVLYEEKHPKYVEPQHPLIFLPWDSSKFIYQSQRSGFNHMYLFDTKAVKEGKETLMENGSVFKENVKVTPLTRGNWLVQNVYGFNAKKQTIIYGSTEVSPLQTNVYSMSIQASKINNLDKLAATKVIIGKEDGMHRAIASASGTYVLDNFTSNAVAREVSILPTNGKKGYLLFSATDPMLEAFNMPEITLGTLKAADGKTDLYYRLIKPVNFDPNKKYPAIIYVYGGPHAQMIHNTRFFDARGWDLYMAQQGYVMLTVDSRGSDNRGREFENCTFRNLGVEEMKDQVQGAKMLQSLPYVDAERIGVHGWSFGGFMTTNLMLTYPEIFKVGVAGGPVIDWQYYEVMYGERYMDTPQANPEGYKNANMKLKAGNLKGRLLIIHGGEDPTCVPQHSYTFLRACIDAGTHPDFFIYPEDGHNMFGRDRVHLHQHITRYFEDFLK